MCRVARTHKKKLGQQNLGKFTYMGTKIVLRDLDVVLHKSRHPRPTTWSRVQKLVGCGHDDGSNFRFLPARTCQSSLQHSCTIVWVSNSTSIWLRFKNSACLYTAQPVNESDRSRGWQQFCPSVQNKTIYYDITRFAICQKPRLSAA